jgi:protein-disulfide isomerase
VTVPDVTDHVLGNPDAPVTLLEYGDYECPYCAAAAPVLRQVVTESGGRVRLIFRNFPLPDVHPFALTAALAAEAAGEQGAFWPMHEMIFTRQDRLDDAALRAYADELGIDGSLVVGDAAQAFGDKVEADFAAGLDAGVGGTPTVFIDGRLYPGRVEAGALRRAIGMGGANGSGPDGGRDPRAGRQRRWTLGLRRTQREPLAEDTQQDDAGDRRGD